MPLPGTPRVPYLLRAPEQTLRMRRAGGDDWRGCSCPTVHDQNGDSIGVLTVCAPSDAGPCAGCTQSWEPGEFSGQTVLAAELIRLARDGWSVIDLKDEAGEACARVPLAGVVRAIASGGLPPTISAETLPPPVLSRVLRCAIAVAAAPLLLLSGAVAMVHVLGLFAPIALVMAPFIVVFLPVLLAGLWADGRPAAEGVVTPIALVPVEAGRGDARDELSDLLVPLHQAPNFAWEPVRIRVRVSSFPGAMPSEPAVFAADVGADPREGFETIAEPLEDTETPAIVA